MSNSKYDLSISDYYIVYISSKFLDLFSLFSFSTFIKFFQYKFLIRNLVIDNKKLIFEGELEEFFFLELKYKVYSLLTLNIYSLFKNGQRIRSYIKKTKFSINNEYGLFEVTLFENIKNILTLVFIGILSLGIYLPFLIYRRKKFIINHIKIGNNYLYLNLSDREYLKYMFKQICLILLTAFIYLGYFLPTYKKYLYEKIILK